MNEVDLITIIVPIYNVEPYLHKCIDSILVQKYNHLEIILVDDGSTDGCRAICDEYAVIDSRIKVIHQSNQGLSQARNMGLAEASGEFIGFVDSDDWISPHMYERLYYEIVKNKADIAACGRYIATDKEIYMKRQGYSGAAKVLTRKEALTSLVAFAEILTSVWNKLYKKSTLLANPFPKGKYFEDLYAMPDILSRCNNIVYIDMPYYYYYLRENSIVHTFSAQHLMDHFEAAIYRNKKIETRYPELKQLAQKSQIIYNTVLYTSFACRRKEDDEIDHLAHLIIEDMKQYPYSLLISVSVRYVPGALLLKHFPAGFYIYALAWQVVKTLVTWGGISRISLKRVKDYKSPLAT